MWQCILSVQVDGAEEGEGEDTLAGVSAYALRTFLRQTRELAYQSVGLLSTYVPALWEQQQAVAPFVAALVGQLEALDHQFLRLLLRHTLIPFVRAVPPQHRCETSNSFFDI